jgi:RecA/RadA recombinase
MNKTINALEQMGSDANLQSEQAIEQLLIATEVNAEQAEAIINQDISSLELQLDVRLDMVCGVVPAEDDEEQEDDSTEETSNRVAGF